MPIRVYKAEYLRTLIKDATTRCLGNEYVDDPPVIDHVAQAIHNSIRSDSFYPVDPKGRMITNLPEMINYAERMQNAGDYAAEYDARIKTGDFTLVTLGLSPGSREVMQDGPAFFAECGRRSYFRAHKIERAVLGRATGTFEAMVDVYPLAVDAIKSIFHGGELIKTINDTQ